MIPTINSTMPTPKSHQVLQLKSQLLYTATMSGLKNMLTTEPKDRPATVKNVGALWRSINFDMNLDTVNNPITKPTIKQR